MTRQFALVVVAVLSACGREPDEAAPAAEPYGSRYAPAPHAPVLIRNATVLTGAGARRDDGDVLLRDGRIAAVGRNVAAPADAVEVDGSGRWVTPGLIDAHSHLGVYPATIYGLDDTLGSIEPGKAADVVLWDGDPLEVTTAPVYVFIAGREIDPSHRQTLLRDRYMRVLGLIED